MDLTAETDVTVRQFYFSGWSAAASDDHVAPTISADDQTGLVILRAPPGRYRIELTLDPLWQESLGLAVSLAGVLSLAIIGLAWLRGFRGAGKPRVVPTSAPRAP